ncbi:MAG: hypothetical protein LAT67_15480 [Balneolales bacterium]|nr:hypothetical protein [Balneolales bacterium]
MMRSFLPLLLFANFLFFLACPANAEPPGEVTVFVADFEQHELRLAMENHATHFFTQINTAFLSNQQPEFDARKISNSAASAVHELWSLSTFYVPDDRIIETIASLRNGYFELRNINVFFTDENGEETYEEVVVQFDAAGSITEFRIGLPTHRFRELLNEGTDVIDQQNRQQILSFVENFRTAYNRMDLPFIRDVFSDQALIIVGRVVENTGTQSQFQAQVEYMQYSKDEYLERLERVFQLNTWINVGFEEISIRRHPRYEEIYGVSLTQYYDSSIYSDVGFLFLLIDFKQPEEPMIHVRTWQPERTTPESEIFNLGDMEIF